MVKLCLKLIYILIVKMNNREVMLFFERNYRIYVFEMMK